MWAILIVAILAASAAPLPPGSPNGNIPPLSRSGAFNIVSPAIQIPSMTRKYSNEGGSPHLASPLTQLSEIDDEKLSFNYPSLSNIADPDSPLSLTPLSHVSEDDQLPNEPQLALIRLESYSATPIRKSSDAEPPRTINIRRKWSDSGFAASGKRYTLGEQLGEGKNGQVFYDAHSKNILIKVMKKSSDIVYEIDALKAVKKFIGIHEENGYDAVVYKYTPGLPLRQFLKSDSMKECFWDFEEFKNKVYDATYDALKRLNDLNIKHGDAHFDNVLFTVNHCKLYGEMIDFSLSRLLDPNDFEKKAKALENDFLYFESKFIIYWAWIQEQFEKTRNG